MNIYLRLYQAECLEMVSEKLNKGYKYLSVVMPVGTGKTVTSIFLAKKLHEKERAEIAMVFRFKAKMIQTEQTANQIGLNHADYYTVRKFLDADDIDKYQYVILHDCSVSERKHLLDRIQGSMIRTISFFDPSQDVAGDHADETVSKKIMPNLNNLSSIACVYVTDDVLDIRDAKYIGRSEGGRAAQENAITVNWIWDERDILINERKMVKREQDRMTAPQFAFYDMANPSKMILKKDAEIKRLQALLKEKDARIAMQDQQIAFQQDVLSRFGIDARIIQDSFEQIQQERTLLKDDLESSDLDTKEIALKKLQDKVAEIVSGLTENTLSSQDYQYFEEYLAAELSDDIWQRLDSKSKTFLITAKSNYESMIKMPDSEELDYSGVCLLVTKALEVETAKRFFEHYKDYLTQRYSSVSQWPYELRQKNHGRVTDNVIFDNEFTLGSVVPVVGFRREYDDEGTIIAYPVNHHGTKNKFLQYARQDLFIVEDRDRVEEAIERDFRFIEKVRLDYRNPSAHRSRLTITSARECLEYVIEVQQMLRIMLQEMKI